MDLLLSWRYWTLVLVINAAMAILLPSGTPFWIPIVLGLLAVVFIWTILYKED